MKIKIVKPDLKAQILDYSDDNVLLIITTLTNERAKHDLMIAFKECFSAREVIVVDTDEVANIYAIDNNGEELELNI